MIQTLARRNRRRYFYGRAEFLPDSGDTGRPDVAGLADDFSIGRLQLKPGDTIVAGSDGRDDCIVPAPAGESGNIMNEDEYRFVQPVAEQNGDLAALGAALKQGGNELTDDLSLLSLRYG